MIHPILRIFLILQCLAIIGRSELADKQLQDLVDKSTLTFIGTVKEMGSNVSGFDSEDFPMIVRVEKVESGDNEALKKFGSLEKSELTVAVNPTSRDGLRNKVFAVFFVDPLVYEKNIGVIANAVAVIDQKTAADFSKRLHAAALRKSEAPLRREVASAELVITGEVETVRPLASDKTADLASVKNGWELFSEHRPRWKEAIIKVHSVEKPPGTKVDFVSVVFPSTHDCFGESSPKFELKQSGIWLLHRNQYKGSDIKSYTALDPADFQPMSMLTKIQQIIAAPQ